METSKSWEAPEREHLPLRPDLMDTELLTAQVKELNTLRLASAKLPPACVLA